jgi:hypothetical protein
VDELVELVISAPDRQTLIARTRALDRVLLWSHYVIPQWHITHFRVAYWDKFTRPPVTPKYALGFESWWVDPAKTAALAALKGGAREETGPDGGGIGADRIKMILAAAAALVLALWIARRIRARERS